MQPAFLNTKLSKETRREVEKLISGYKRLEAIIESKKMDCETKTTVNYQATETQRGNQFHSETERLALIKLELADYVLTKNKLKLVYDSLNPVQKQIWEQRYVLGRFDVDVYTELDITDKKYYRLKHEILAAVADAFSLFVTKEEAG